VVLPEFRPSAFTKGRSGQPGAVVRRMFSHIGVAGFLERVKWKATRSMGGTVIVWHSEG
jgi:hypothetical protein